MQARAHGADRRLRDRGNLCVAKAFNFMQHHNSAVLGRQALQRIVELFLQLLHQGALFGARLGRQMLKNLAVRHLVVHIFVANITTSTAFLEKGHRGIDRDTINPSKELGLALKSSNRLKGFDKGILGQVRRVFAIAGHVVNDSKDRLAVFLHQLVKGGYVTALHLLHQGPVKITL